MHYVYGRYITSQPVNIEIIMLYPRKPKIMRYMQNIVCYINIILYIMYLMRRNAQKKNRGYLEESIERLYDLFRVMETKRKKKRRILQASKEKNRGSSIIIWWKNSRIEEYVQIIVLVRRGWNGSISLVPLHSVWLLTDSIYHWKERGGRERDA